jgi:hypothetical protein
MPQNYFQSLTILWFALMLGQIIFLIIFRFVIPVEPIPELQGMLEYIACAAMVGAMMVSPIIYKQLIDKAQHQDLAAKKVTYRTANIIKGAMLEGANLFCIIAYGMTQTYWLLFVILGGLTWFYLQMPSRLKFINEVSLTAEEQLEAQ